MTDERYKQIMNNLGMPDSQSLLSALQQVANEAGQEAMRNEREACAVVCDSLPETDKSGPWFNDDMSYAASLCAMAIRVR